MINYETILSSYDDKLTLMQWLKKVEAALNDASATGFHVNKRGNATITFSIDFENGETLESEPLVLQQGESVVSGEIRNGHLFLTLSNGDELDCGSLFNGEIPSLNVRSLEVSGGLILDTDANASIGGDLVVHGLTEVENIRAYGHVETETLTAAGDEISAQKPVVEVMTGYSAQLASTSTGWLIENVYTSACKNGNKLTLVCAFHLTKTLQSGANNSPAIVDFTIPASVGAKIFPETEVFPAVEGICDIHSILAFHSGGAEQVTSQIRKTSSTKLRMYLTNIEALFTYNQKNYLRYEVTFLLSDGLI